MIYIDVVFFDQKNRPYRLEYYYFKGGKWPLGKGVPNAGCEFPSQDDSLSLCTGGFFWQEDIYVDFRLPAKYAGDWPAIYQEIIRVLSLLRKVSP